MSVITSYCGAVSALSPRIVVKRNNYVKAMRYTWDIVLSNNLVTSSHKAAIPTNTDASDTCLIKSFPVFRSLYLPTHKCDNHDIVREMFIVTLLNA